MTGNFYHKFRRAILKRFVPEFLWPTYVELSGVRIKIRNTPYSFGIKYLLCYHPEKYEEAERLLMKHIQPGDRVLEMGSSIGVMTRIIGEKVKPNGKVLAIEASEELTRYSRTWLEEQENIKVVQKLAFPVYHPVSLQVNFDDEQGSLGGRVIFDSSGINPVRNNLFFIRDAETEYQFEANVLVCDIEGSEIVIGQSSPEFPSSLDRIIIELHPSLYDTKTLDHIISEIERQGFAGKEKIGSVYFFQREK